MVKKMTKINLNTHLYGSSICLRPVIIEDAAIIRKWHNDSELIKLARVGEKRTTLRQEKEDIEAARKSGNQAYHLILVKVDDTPIGFLRFNFIDKSSGNIWLRMIIGNKKAQGKGYAREALQCYLKWMFDKLKIHRITLECYSTNSRAIQFYKKIGFQKEGVLREAVFINGKYYDIISFGMLKKDFKN
ncbi:GNAT family N-acetyltransferase [candidate division WOR-3 bacterium]|jgi:RimJ/RimL family protein N-acetyltransferase|nr:GNAT family N-acetyltransferase [candidate division WOR-3 bacterium]